MRETHIMTITFIATGGWIRFDRHLEDASAKDYDVVIILKTLASGNGSSKPRLSAVAVRAARSAYEAGSGITAGACLTAGHTLDGSLRQTHTFHGWPLPQRSERTEVSIVRQHWLSRPPGSARCRLGLGPGAPLGPRPSQPSPLRLHGVRGSPRCDRA